jgi:hypothetical protein
MRAKELRRHDEDLYPSEWNELRDGEVGQLSRPEVALGRGQCDRRSGGLANTRISWCVGERGERKHLVTWMVAMPPVKGNFQPLTGNFQRLTHYSTLRTHPRTPTAVVHNPAQFARPPV